MNQPVFHIVIPARMASQRLPDKPLAPLAGRPLIEHVFGRAREAGAASVSIATDDERVRSVAEGFGAAVIMTSADHPSGTDRIAECALHRGWDDDTIIVNLQGDEPLMPAACLAQVAGLLADDRSADWASLWWPLESAAEIEDSNAVKVAVARDGAALYFSRSVIPHPRGWGGVDAGLGSGAREPVWKRHVGLYAYRVAALRAFSKRSPTPLEQAERLEQLRVLEYGGRIAMARACEEIPAGVDTPADLERVERRLTRGRP